MGYDKLQLWILEEFPSQIDGHDIEESCSPMKKVKTFI